MPTRQQSHILIYRAINTLSGEPVSGDVGNHTLLWSKDGAAGVTPTNAPSARATAGLYQVVITASEADCEVGVMTGVSATAHVLLEKISVAYQVAVNLTTAERAAVRADGLNVALLTGQTVELTPAYQATLTTAIEAALIDDEDGQALRDAILQTINDSLDLPELQVQAVATACRDAILNRVLAGNHEAAGSVGAQLLKIDDLLLAADYVEPDNDGVTDAAEAATSAAAGVVTLQQRLTAERAEYLDAIPDIEAGQGGEILIDGFTGAALGQLAGNGNSPLAIAAPVVKQGLIEVYRGDDYADADGRAFRRPYVGTANLMGASVALLASKGTLTRSLAMSYDSQATQLVLPLTAAQTLDLVPGTWKYEIEITLAEGSVITCEEGTLLVLASM